MKLWKMKLYKRKKEGINNTKTTRNGTDVVKQSRSSTGVSATSCLKKPHCENDGSVMGGRRADSVSTGVESVNETTVTTCGSSSGPKKVRFDVVEIRNYERIASDNPCCSSGPPIGIGWNHDASQIADVNDYEENRGPRRVNLEFVLSRSEREEILLEWAVDMKTIANSTREAMKAKFQRKQTFINSRKLSKLEEVMESTSRRLKNAFSSKRRNDVLDEPLETTTSQVFGSDHSGTGETVSISSVGDDSKSHPHVTEPEDDSLENLMKTTLDISTAGERDEGNDASSRGDDFTLGATTLGNTSEFSPSVVEIEKFYKDLELEMFGEEIELPSMVGQTLEVPLDNAKIHDEKSFSEKSSSNPQSAHLEKHPSRFFRDEAQSNSYDNHTPQYAQETYENYDGRKITAPSRMDQQCFGEHRYEHAEPEQTHSNFTFPYITYNDSMSPTVPHYPVTRRHNMPFARSGPDPNYRRDPSAFFTHMQSPRDGYQQYYPRRGTSFDSSYNVTTRHHGNSYLSPASQPERSQTTFQHHERIPTGSSLDAADLNFRYSDPGPQYAQPRSSRRRSRRSSPGEPRVEFMPLRGSYSTNEWTDDCDQQPSFSSHEAAVIISEGS